MSEKSALFMARTTRFHEFARSLTTTLGVEVSLATPDSPTAAHDFDLLILDSDGIRSDRIDQIAKWLDDRGGVPMLVIVDDEALGTLRLPNHAHADFVCPTVDTQRAQGSRAAPDGRGGDRHRRRCTQYR